MAVERGQRTTVRFGGVRAEVSLVKTSGKPAGMPEHETRRVLAPTVDAHPEVSRSRAMVDPFGDAKMDPTKVAAAEDIPAGAEVAATPDGRAHVRDPFAEGAIFAAARNLEDALEAGRVTMDTEDAAHDAARLEALEQAEAERVADAILAPAIRPVPGAPKVTGPVTPDELRAIRAEADARRVAVEAPDPQPATEYVPPATVNQQGVTLADGTWLDLTERFAEVDEGTKVEGLEVVATIATTVVPRERVRDAHYVATADTKTSKVLALLWHGLRESGAAAVVRWTKRTAQVPGIIVARGTLGRGAHLVLLELEWSENMREPGRRTLEPVAATVTRQEVEAAVELVEAFAAPAAVLDDLRDERRAKRAELLELARAGSLEAYVPPPEREPDADGLDLAAALTASAAARR